MSRRRGPEDDVRRFIAGSSGRRLQRRDFSAVPDEDSSSDKIEARVDTDALLDELEKAKQSRAVAPKIGKKRWLS